MFSSNYLQKVLIKNTFSGLRNKAHQQLTFNCNPTAYRKIKAKEQIQDRLKSTYQKMTLSTFESLIKVSTLAWWQLWNFIEFQAKFNIFSYHNDHIQRIFWYLVRLFESELSKIGDFQSSELFLEAKFHLIILTMIFSSQYQSRRTSFIQYIFDLKCFH